MLEPRGSERREKPRASFVAAVRQEGGAHVGLALAQNICESGMELQLADDSPMSTEIDLRFELPDGRGVVEAAAAVVFVYRQGKYQHAGVRFTRLSRKDKARIARVVSAR